MEVALPLKIVTLIPPKPEYSAERKNSFHQLRVAAYCRVSTEAEEQQSSFEAKVNYNIEKINRNSEWKMVRIFAD